MKSYYLNGGKSTKQFSPAGQIGMLIMFLGAGFILTTIAQLAMSMLILPQGTDMKNMSGALLSAMKDPKNVNIIRWMQAVGTLFLMMLPALLYAIVCWFKPFFWLGFNKDFNAKQVVLAFAIMLAAGFLVTPLGDLSKMVVSNFPDLNASALKMEKDYNDQVMIMSNLHNWGEYFMAIILMAFLPAMFEEVFFRGALQPVLERMFKNPWAAIIVTSLIFSAIHLSIYLFVSRLVLGIILGLLFYYSKNIWVSIIAHFINNAIAVSQMWFLKLQNKPVDLNKLDPELPMWTGLIALAAVYFLFQWYRKFSAENRMKVETSENILLQQADPFAAISANSKYN